jgi:hypothetical protein
MKVLDDLCELGLDLGQIDDPGVDHLPTKSRAI